MPKIRSLLVSFSVNNRCGFPSQCSRKLPSSACDVSIVTVFSSGFCRKEGFGWSGHQVQVLRNHKVGSTCSLSRLGPPIATADLDQDVGRRRFRVFDEHIEITVIIEDAGIEQFVFPIVAAAPPVRFDQIAVGICVLRIFVEVLHVRVGRRAVEIEVVFLDVLAVIALAIGQAEQPLLQDRVLAVPQRERQSTAADGRR